MVVTTLSCAYLSKVVEHRPSVLSAVVRNVMHVSMAWSNGTSQVKRYRLSKLRVRLLIPLAAPHSPSPANQIHIGQDSTGTIMSIRSMSWVCSALNQSTGTHHQTPSEGPLHPRSGQSIQQWLSGLLMRAGDPQP